MYKLTESLLKVHCASPGACVKGNTLTDNEGYKDPMANSFFTSWLDLERFPLLHQAANSHENLVILHPNYCSALFSTPAPLISI